MKIYNKHLLFFTAGMLLWLTGGAGSLANSFDGQVSRALFTTEMKNNKPVNEVFILENSVQQLFFYSEIQNMKGKTISHSWEHRGERLHHQEFRIETDRQGLVSSHKLSPARTGEWMVLIRDNGRPIKAVMFKYVKKGSFAGKGIVPIK